VLRLRLTQLRTLSWGGRQENSIAKAGASERDHAVAHMPVQNERPAGNHEGIDTPKRKGPPSRKGGEVGGIKHTKLR